MPETTVYENGKSLGCEVEIWVANYIRRMKSPPPNARAYKCQPQNNLGALVAFASYGRHNSRAG
jgi:hypothetical protein